MVSNLTETLPCPKFTLFKTKAYLPIIKIIFLNRFATDDYGALMSYLEGTLRYLWLGGGGGNSSKSELEWACVLNTLEFVGIFLGG